jgi:hypothetical protein
MVWENKHQQSSGRWGFPDAVLIPAFPFRPVYSAIGNLDQLINVPGVDWQFSNPLTDGGY